MRIQIGDFVEITAKGLTVRGVVKYSDGDGSPRNEYNIEVVNERTGKVHYWKQAFDGGTVKVLERNPA